jgi:hypothetical protein
MTMPDGPVTAHGVMERYLSAARSGNWDEAFAYLADDLLVHIPGRSRFAGDHCGKAAAIAYIRSVRDRYGEDGIELELIDMLAGDERVALLVCERFHDGGSPIEIRRANVYRIADGQIVEISIFEADQYVVDEVLVGDAVVGEP